MTLQNASNKLSCRPFSYKTYPGRGDLIPLSARIVRIFYDAYFPSQHRHARCLLIALVGLFLLAACNHKDWFPQPKKQMTPVEVSGFGHLGPGWGVPSYYVNGVSGGNSSGMDGGGSFSCCISIPSKWREGLVAKVKWNARGGNNENDLDHYYEKILPIPYYDEAATLRVHFFPDGVAAIVVWRGGVSHPEYPWPDLTGYYSPWIYERNGRKFNNATNKEIRK